MARYRRRKEASLIDLIPPLAGLIALGLFVSPAFRQLLGTLFFLALCLAGLAVAGLIVWAIWRFTSKPADTEQFLPPVSVQSVPPATPVRVHPVSPPIVSKPVWSQDLLSDLEWKRFEEVVAAYSRELGYEAKTTRIGADGGVDVQLFQNGQIVMIIQCKAWNAYKVGVKPMRELYGVMADEKISNGAFFTTGEFTSEAEEWARNKNLDLVNGREFLSRIRQLSSAAQDKLLALATAGDYTTPTCPSCDIKMVLRTASKGRNEGSQFYGCRNYPGCKQTFKAA
jgi:restriction system protein